jgi:hypothetical protein
MYKIQVFFDGEVYATAKIPAQFPLRNGGAESIEVCMISDREQAVAFVTNYNDAKKICAALNFLEAIKK